MKNASEYAHVSNFNQDEITYEINFILWQLHNARESLIESYNECCKAYKRCELLMEELKNVRAR